MEKRTILAIVLIVGIFFSFTILQNVLYKPSPQTVSTTKQVSTTITSVVSQSLDTQGNSLSADRPRDTALLDASKPDNALIPQGSEPYTLKPIVFSNGEITVTIDPVGADVSSLQLVKYKDGEKAVNMLAQVEGSGLVTKIGGKNGQTIDAAFNVTQSADGFVYEFSRDFQINNRPGKSFTIIKKYTFFPEEYLFQLDVQFVQSKESANETIPLNVNGSSYTLAIEPQVGPLTSVNNPKTDPRRYVYLNTNGRQVETLKPGKVKEISSRVTWAAVDSKYFSFFIIPGAADFMINFDRSASTTSVLTSALYFTRGELQGSNVKDTFRIYAGPKLANFLEKYNRAEDNKAGQTDLNLKKIVDDDWLWWLSESMKWIMQIFYNLVGNWGVSIIMLTILVKVLLYPLTKKGMESTARMQALNPKMTELREKFKDNPQKMNAELADLYKKEKINPLGGCLPMLLQFPFFIAMYSLFNNHFDLRGAMFIPGWITDLSLPESIWNWGSFTLPFLNWNDLRLLPILYFASQIVSSKLSPTSNTGGSNTQMKIMMYALPAVFFFILYEVPSGLLVYWIFQNVLGAVQQVFVNRHLKTKGLATKPTKK